MTQWTKPMDDSDRQKITEISMALQVLSKLAVPEFAPDGSIHLRIITKEEWDAGTTNSSPVTPKLIPVEPSVRRDGSTPFVWVFTCPPPYNGVEIVCVPDAATNIGIRCTASVPNMSRERDKYHIIFMGEGERLVAMDEEAYREYEEYIEGLDQER